MMRNAAPWWTRLGVIALLTVAMLAQTLGLVHRTAHSGPLHNAASAHFASVSTHVALHTSDHHLDPSNDVGPSWAERLFAGHDGGVSCAVYDAQTTVYQGFMLIVQVFIAQIAMHLIAFSQITSTARAAALFEARGPPAAL